MGGSCLNRVFPRNTQHDDKGKFNKKNMGGSCLNRVFPRNTQHDDKGKFNNKTWEVPV